MLELRSGGGVARVFLDRPEKANALTAGLLRELHLCFEKLKGDASVRAVVLGGRGNAFCGGADVDELRALTAQNASDFVFKIHSVCKAIRELPVPVVARLHGAAIGAGLEIAAACDLRLAAEGTKLAMPEVRLGIPSVVEAALLPRLMGSGRAAWLVLTGEAIDARQACAWGLVEKVAADLDAETESVLKSLLAGEREALRVQKQLLQLWEESPLGDAVAASIEEFAKAYRQGAPTALRKLRR